MPSHHFTARCTLDMMYVACKYKPFDFFVCCLVIGEEEALYIKNGSYPLHRLFSVSVYIYLMALHCLKDFLGDIWILRALGINLSTVGEKL